MNIMRGEMTMRCDASCPTIEELSKLADLARGFGIPSDAKVEDVRISSQMWNAHGLDHSDVTIRWRRDEVAP